MFYLQENRKYNKKHKTNVLLELHKAKKYFIIYPTSYLQAEISTNRNIQPLPKISLINNNFVVQ